MASKTPSATGKAEQHRSTFRQSCGVAIRVAASPERVWALLTDARDFPRWNSTVTSIDGDISDGNKLKLRVPISPRTFTPKVSDFHPPRRMVWSDGMAPMFRGVRTFEVKAHDDGTSEFTMVEVMSGLMLPMVRRSLPDFGPVFETYAADLKREAETSAKPGRA